MPSKLTIIFARYDSKLSHLEQRIRFSQASKASKGNALLCCVHQNIQPLIWDIATDNYQLFSCQRKQCVMCLSAFSRSQNILMTAPITNEHEHLCPQLEPLRSVSTSPGFTSQQKIGQHKFQRYCPPANRSDSLTAISTLLYVRECFAVRAKKLIPAESPLGSRLTLFTGRLFHPGDTSLEMSFPCNFS